MSRAGKRLLAAAQEMRQIARGEAEPAHMHIPPEIDVRTIRKALDLSQEDFAFEFYFSINQVRNWEQGRSRPLGGDRVYLLLIRSHPEEMRRMLEDIRKEQTSENVAAAM